MEKLTFIPQLLKENEKLKTVEKIESFTGLAHNDAMILYVLAKTKKITISLTKGVTENDINQLYTEDCITIDDIKVNTNPFERNEYYENYISGLKEEIKTLQEKLKEANPSKNQEISQEIPQEISTNIFKEPVVMLNITKYNQMKQQLKEYTTLKEQSNIDMMKAHKEIEKLEKIADQNAKNSNKYKNLFDAIEKALNQFK